ncbi:hypothetical protein D3C87_1450380 [compost metagenome]
MLSGAFVVDPQVLTAQQIEQQAVVAAEFLRCLRLAVSRQVIRRCDSYPVSGADVASDQAAVIQRADPERDIQTLADQILILIAQLQVDLNLGIAHEEFRQARCNLQAPEADGGTDSQWPGDGFPAGLKAVLGGVHCSENVSAFGVVALAFVGQR